MRQRIVMAAALTACVACSTGPDPNLVLDGSVEARPIQCGVAPDGWTCPRVGGTEIASCGPDDDPDYIWIHVCGDSWGFQCDPLNPEDRLRWVVAGPCAGCLDGEPFCDDFGRPNCAPIPRDCAVGWYSGPER